MATSNPNEQLSAVVLLAHGPATATLTALRRLEAIADEQSLRVHVVAGTEPGMTALDRVADRGIATTDDHGPDALRSALSGLHGTVAVLHDDVVVTSEALRSLTVAHQQSGLVAVASGAALPQTTTLDSAGVTCAVGSIDQLGTLADHAAFAPGVEAAGPFVAPAGAVATHSGTCQQRLADPSPHRPLLVAAMIVRDEGEQLAACLDSLDGIVDRIEVADTGSLDDTIAIARAAGAHITEIGWRNDFAWARNQVRERCLDATYMLWIDADERLVCDDAANLRKVLATNARLHPGYRFAIHNLTDDGDRTHSFVARRIVDPNVVQFEGAVHEQPIRLDGNPLRDAMLAGLSIDHHGYEDALVAQRNKAERNLRIATDGFDRDPNGTTALHLARAMGAASSDPAATLSGLEKLAPLVLAEAEPAQALFHSLRAELLLAADDLPATIEAATAALELIPADATAGAVLAEALSRAGRFDELLDTAMDHARRTSPTPLVDDRLAARTRARLIFEAAIHLDRFDVALDQTGELGDELDPWSALATRGGRAVLLDGVDVASERADTRFLRALVSLPDLSSAELAAARAAFDGPLDDDLDALLDTVGERLVTVEEAPRALADYERTGAVDDAMRYARQLTTNHIDLTMELDDLHTGQPAALALSVAAESHRRRGRLDEAVANARRALDLDPGSGRAADVLAEHLLPDDPTAALAIIERAQSDELHDRNPTTVRRNLAARRVRALLALGELRDAVGHAVDLLDLGGEVEDWPRLLELAGEDLEALSPILGLVLLTDGVTFIDALPQAVGPERTAVICAAYLGMGGQNPEAVSVGVLAAAMTGQIDLGCLLAGHSNLLPGDIIERLVEHLDRNEAAPIAAALRAPQRLSA